MATLNISQCCFETAAVVVLLKKVSKEVKDLPVKIALFPFCCCLVNFYTEPPGVSKVFESNAVFFRQFNSEHDRTKRNYLLTKVSIFWMPNVVLPTYLLSETNFATSPATKSNL